MGLDIYAKTTGEFLSGGYSRLHHTARYLALIYCGMPEYIDYENKEQTFVLYMGGYVGDTRVDSQKMIKFMYALQMSSLFFPNLLLHSDCEGTYTKRGKLDLHGSLMTGNSVALMKELEMLVNEKKFQEEKYSEKMKYTKAFYELVKKEVEEGKGRIEFH